MRIVCAILLVVLIGVTWQLKNEIDANRLQAADIQSLSARLADKAKRETFDLQQKCAAQAEQTFHRLGYREGQSTGDVISAIFQAHYNPEHNQCFMTLETLLKGGFQFKSLFDAYENRTYAEYDWMPQEGKSFDKVLPAVCRLVASTGNERTCKSEDEYRAFVAHYME
ncbi:hypothetical protein EVC45_42035 [Paraburkholderia sp. UYCP14C]|uniref:hypothetical protein n=1 Tax=Paraburkholderia sp. UYCP14C TaxID=2511130 RepID=UPI00102164AA|nr:hypothetical protein [Paraburkholderia sp. UYCP14C]RZF23850.1 hypothetical protein EVC45_42035 [Paraburkholderia sp. UYCP14C]